MTDSRLIVPLDLPTRGEAVDKSSMLDTASNDLWRVILEAEVNSFHWTLMHRFHKASDIINEVCFPCARGRRGEVTASRERALFPPLKT